MILSNGDDFQDEAILKLFCFVLMHFFRDKSSLTRRGNLMMILGIWEWIHLKSLLWSRERFFRCRKNWFPRQRKKYYL